MDPVAHTLFGAALAETGLKRTTRYATATLIVSANLPDIDVIAHVAGHDASLYFRRGWSHGILALILLPLILAGLMWLWHRWRAHRATAQGPPFRLGAIVGLSYLGVASHLLLDWMNTYGVRLLMPFDGTWFYGDTLFIIDPWFWLLAGVGVVLARSHHLNAIIGWALLGLLSTGLILTSDFAPTPVKVLWLIGLAAIVALRWQRLSPARIQGLSQVGLAALVLYIGAVYGLARMAEASLAQEHPQAEEVQSNPVPGLPHQHRLVVQEEDQYRMIHADGEITTLERQPVDAIVGAAMADESIRGFITWMRYPYWEVEETDDGWTVEFYDLRYVWPGRDDPGIGRATVTVHAEDLDADAP